MKKKIASIILLLSMVVMSGFASIAGTRNNIEFKDLKRLQEVMSRVSNQKCTIINYQKISGAEWMIRVEAADSSQEFSRYSGDYRVTFVDMEPNVNIIPSKCWFYAGVYDDSYKHELQGFAVATREYRKQLNQFYTYPQADDYAIPELQ